MRAVNRTLLLTVLAVSVAACQTTLTPQPNPGGSTAPAASADDGALQALPDNYRRQVAVSLLNQYLTDADGPAVIERPMRNRITGVPRFTVRLRIKPEKATKTYFFDSKDGYYYRCIDFEYRDALFGDKKYFYSKWSRSDSHVPCSTYLTFEPFPELDEIADTIRKCREKGETECAISLKLPAPEAAKPPTKPARGLR
ncbi:hypothetical protein ASG52_14715 [Methylobacterium sp. Leaf456]|uniref:hypothetical protein n=1 Tax=Methylobacterium sp. Leaf456 TaxID=1736382 RepID=UPI0006F9AF36|nr:hypothetical protein [Methylobacterium sp. Leaf456]KQT45416.1 hypothetical protein ASG52_14715 [Methylobacterium sp. Leaf456]